MISAKVHVKITRETIEEYRRANKSPNLFQHYIMQAIHYSELSKDALSVFVFQEEIRITLPPNNTRLFKVPNELGLCIIRYYQVRDTCPVEFILDFADNTITINSIGDDVK